MDFDESGIICTKNRLWKKKLLVIEIVDFMSELGYQFTELIYGEPDDFVFTEDYNEIMNKLKTKGNIFGIRIKFKKGENVVHVSSNTHGVDNVKYTVFAENEEELVVSRNDVMSLKELMKPSNDTVAKTSEYLVEHKNIRNGIIIVLVAILMYSLGAHVFFFDLISIIFSFAPILVIILLFSYFRNRR